MVSPVIHENEWQTLLNHLPLWQLPLQSTLVLSPHPDDETLGAGGLIATLRAAQIEAKVVAVTDGEQAYFDLPHPDPARLAITRELEQTAALAHLGVDAKHIHRLRLPDSGLSRNEEELTARLLPLANADTHIVAPWPHDFHPDHEVCGRAALRVAQQTGAALTSYFFWTWHRGTLGTLSGLPLRSLPLTPAAQLAKDQALACHRSQLQHSSGSPILPEYLLGPARRSFEVFLPS